MPWQEKAQPTALDSTPIPGLYFLIGDLLAQHYQQDWTKGQKYPLIHYPSGLQRELDVGTAGGETVSVFGALKLPRQASRDEAFQSAAQFASKYDYTVGRRGQHELLIFHPHSGNGYTIKYDNRTRQLVDIRRIPNHAMELLDGEGRAVLPKLYSSEKLGLEAIAPLKFFAPGTAWSWYPTEYDGSDLCFGLVAGFEVELGYFSVAELEGLRGAFGLPLERDLYWKPMKLRDIQALPR